MNCPSCWDGGGGLPQEKILTQDVCRSDSKAFRGFLSCEMKPILQAITFLLVAYDSILTPPSMY